MKPENRVRSCQKIENRSAEKYTEVADMKRVFTLEYWQDDGWYVGRIKEIPGVFSQGETLEELEENIEDAYRLIMEEMPQINHPVSQTKEVHVEMI